uniref:Uncharacterized protein n=1 Tax=Picea glauca TaxID=3330 RepID=A0A117NHS7_PICGL|nr:hypothetical protein ABT39_MTgene4194 [Picea glauca]
MWKRFQHLVRNAMGRDFLRSKVGHSEVKEA